MKNEDLKSKTRFLFRLKIMFVWHHTVTGNMMPIELFFFFNVLILIMLFLTVWKGETTDYDK